MTVRGELKGFISWNGWYYGYKPLKIRVSIIDQRM